MFSRVSEPSAAKKPRISCKSTDQSFVEFSARNCDPADFGARFVQDRRDFFKPASSRFQSSNSVVYPTAHSALFQADAFNRIARDRLLPITPPESPELLCLPMPNVASKTRIFYPTQNISQMSWQHARYPEAYSSIFTPSYDDTSGLSGQRVHYSEIYPDTKDGFTISCNERNPSLSSNKRRFPSATVENKEAECLPAGDSCLHVEEERKRMLDSPTFDYRGGDKLKKSPLAGSFLPEEPDNGKTGKICPVLVKEESEPLHTADDEFTSNGIGKNDKDAADQKEQLQDNLGPNIATEAAENAAKSNGDISTAETDTNSSISDSCALPDISFEDDYHYSIPKINKERLDIKTERKDEKAACKIYGLLSVQGTRERRYEISVDELQRRVGAPEHLNKVDMISYVRLAKNSARDLLQRHDIVQPLHNRRSKHTILSKVSERECQELADGINSINIAYFPTESLARKSVKAVTIDRENLKRNAKRRFQELEITSSVLSRMIESIAGSSSFEREMEEFDLITHTFGIRNLCHHIKFLVNYMEEEKTNLQALIKKQQSLDT